MSTSSSTLKFSASLFLVVSGLLLSSCAGPAEVAVQNTNSPAANEVPEAPPEGETAENIDPSILERLRTESWKGDIDGMVQRRYVRAIVLYNKTNFFYDGPQARGITYEALKEFEKFLNAKLNTGKEPVHVIVIPVSREERFKRMSDGRADLVASNLPITAEVKKTVDFSDPVRENVKQVVVTGRSEPPVASLDDLSGREVFVRKNSRYWPKLEELSGRLRASGKPPVTLKEADPNLEDEDLLEMVNAGMVGMTVMDDMIANFWAKVFDGITVHNDLQLAADDRIGWGVQKNTPQFLALVNEFVKDHKLGTSFGNTLANKYLKDTKFAKNNTTPEDMDRFKNAIGFFKKYGGQYGFDWLMIAAQAYQESQIDQSRRSPAGAVGVMQIKPSTAADKMVNIPDVESNMENNINAGVKYMNFIMQNNFKDAKLDGPNRSLFAFASYNAGPARVSQLRKQAEKEGFNPNLWFNNVEIIAAREIGKETVTYVSNIYKYYVAYKMVSEEVQRRKKA